MGGGGSYCELAGVQGEEQGLMQEQEQAPGQASEEGLCVQWENWGLHQVQGWPMVVDEAQERAVLSWPQSQNIWRAEVPTALPFQRSSS